MRRLFLFFSISHSLVLVTLEYCFLKMWKDDEYWYPVFLQKKLFRGYLLFQGTEKQLGYNIEEVIVMCHLSIET